MTYFPSKKEKHLKFLALASYFFCETLFGQLEAPKFYVGLDYYRHTALVANSYASLKGGAELFSYKFISPEIDFNYYLGTTESVTNRDAQTQMPISILRKNFQGYIWGLAPKLYWGDSEYRFVVIPKYSFGNIVSKGSLTTNINGPIEESIKTKVNFWSFSVGIEGELNNDRFLLGFYLVYTGFDAGKSLNLIDLETTSISNINTETLGLQARISYSIWDKK